MSERLRQNSGGAAVALATEQQNSSEGQTSKAVPSRRFHQNLSKANSTPVVTASEEHGRDLGDDRPVRTRPHAGLGPRLLVKLLGLEA